MLTYAQDYLIESAVIGCEKELFEYCGEVTAGDGRLAQCLLDNKSALRPRRRSAIDITEFSAE